MPASDRCTGIFVLATRAGVACPSTLALRALRGRAVEHMPGLSAPGAVHAHDLGRHEGEPERSLARSMHNKAGPARTVRRMWRAPRAVTHHM